MAISYEAPSRSLFGTSAGEYLDAVLACVPGEADRQRIEVALQGRLDPGISIEQAIATYGHPRDVAEFYLASVPLEGAPFFRRVAAALIDIPSVLLTAGVALYFGWMLFGQGNFIAAVMTRNPVALVLCLAALILASPMYYIIAETWTSRTIGKAVMGLRTVRESGARITVGQAFVRQIPLFFNGFYAFDVLFSLFTKKRQRLFELISKTRVIRV